jgi:geranylgeranylglycerol-phosphate geranylgeranyltransferase
VALTALCAFLICAAGNIFNDIRDIESDKISHPNRILSIGRLPLSCARRLAVVANLGAVAVSFAAGIPVVTVVISTILLLHLYNWKLKDVPLLGNLLVAVISGTTFMAGGLASSSNDTFVLPGPVLPACLAFLLHLMRELVKDILDAEGDRAVGVATLPSLIGTRWVLAIVAALSIVLSWASYQPYVLEWYGVQYLWITTLGVLLPTASLSIITLVWPLPNLLRLFASILKVSMVVGFIALVYA